MMREVEGAVTFSPAPGVRVVAVAAARVREWRRRSGESRAERRRGAADDDERSRRCLRLFTAASEPEPVAGFTFIATAQPFCHRRRCPHRRAATDHPASRRRCPLCRRPPPVSAFALDLSPHSPPPSPSTSRRLPPPPLHSSPTLPWNSKCAKLWGRGHAVLASLLSLTSCYALLILFGCLRVCAPTQITLNSACVAKTRPPPMPLRRHSHPHHPSRHAQ